MKVTARTLVSLNARGLASKGFLKGSRPHSFLRLRTGFLDFGVNLSEGFSASVKNLAFEAQNITK